MEEQLLSLKWNNHTTSFLNKLSSLHKADLFSDVTLACDGKYFEVHKFVLSVCSEYFSEILSRTKCQHPVIILKDIRHKDLEMLLNYMYLGEANVVQCELSQLIKAAECLKIRGLAVLEEPEPEKKRRLDNSKEESLTHKKRRHNSSNKSKESRVTELPVHEQMPIIESYRGDGEHEEESACDPIEIKQELKVEPMDDENKGISYDHTADNFEESNAESNSAIDEYATDPLQSSSGYQEEGIWDYSNESYTPSDVSQSQSAGLDFIETLSNSSLNFSSEAGQKNLSNPKNTCLHCFKNFLSSHDLKRHFRVHTGERPYKCDYCPYRGTQKSSVRRHTLLKHKNLLN